MAIGLRKYMNKKDEIIKYRFSDPKRANDICRDLLQHGIQSGNDYEIAYAYLYMGDTYFSMGKMDEAVKYLMMSEKLHRENGFDDLLTRTCNILGVIYVNMGDILLAMEYYHEAMEIAKKTNNFLLLAMICNNLGALFSNIDDQVEAAEYYRKSYKYCTKCSDDGNMPFNSLLLHMNICEGLRGEKRYEQEKQYLENVVGDIDLDKELPFEQITIIHVYAMLYFELEEYDKAYEECMKILNFETVDLNDVELFDDYLDIAKILLKMNRLENIQSVVNILDEMAENTDIDSRRLKLCDFRIRLYEMTGQKEEREEQFRIYYRIKKRINQERNNITINAIDNRCRLEDERKKNKILNEDNIKLAKESEIDELTRIYNRLALRRRYDKLYGYALRKQMTYCVGIFDVDHFKAYNDTYGHLKGDECLKLVARILRRTSDGDYCVARYGGDEFIFMANDVTDDDVRDFAGRLVDNIRKENILFESNQPSGRVTISVGAVLCKAVEGMKLTELVKQADKVLYEVKQSGRDGYKIGNLLSE